MITAAGGACSESLDSRFTKEATRLAGRCLCGVASVRASVRAVSYLRAVLREQEWETGHSRRAEEELRESEEAGAVLQVEDVPVEEAVQSRVERRVVPVSVRAWCRSVVNWGA